MSEEESVANGERWPRVASKAVNFDPDPGSGPVPGATASAAITSGG
jgi:hypothetical protein